MKIKLPNDYKLNNCGNYYTVSDYHGRDLFYYKPEYLFQGFPAQINVLTSKFSDQFLSYCEQKMNDLYISDEKLQFYIINYFNRLLKYRTFDIYKIDEYLLDKNGSFSPILHAYYLSRYNSVTNNMELYFKPNLPYSINNQNWFFKIVEKQIFNIEIEPGIIEIDRADFERELSIDALKFEYVEGFHTSNQFYYEMIEEEHFKPYFKECYYMTVDKHLQFFFVK